MLKAGWIIALVMVGVGVWTWFGPLGQVPAQIGPGWQFLSGMAIGMFGAALFLIMCVASLF